MSRNRCLRSRGQVAVLALAGLLVACGPTPPSPTLVSAPTATPPVAAATSAPGHVLDQITFCFFPGGGTLDASSYNSEIWAGVQRGAQAIGAKATNFAIEDTVNFSNDIAQLIISGTDVLVIDVAFMQPVIQAAARKYPAVYFVGLDQVIDPTATIEVLPNYASLVIEEDKAGFLAGALAAQITRTRKVSAIEGLSSYPQSWRTGEGYRAGVRYIDPAITVQVEYHDDVDIGRSFSDPDWGQSHAQRQLKNGSDVLFAGGGGGTGRGALAAVGAYKPPPGQPVFAIGTGIDEYEELPEARAVLVSSALMKNGLGAEQLIRSIGAGTFQGGPHTGEVGLAPFHDLAGQVPAAVQTRLQQITQSLNDGSLQTHVPPSKAVAP